VVAQGIWPAPSGLLDTRVVTVTPEMAARWLTDWKYPRQRPLREGHVEMLAATIRRGTFETTAIQVRTVGKRTYLIDGQHRLSAIVLSGMPATVVVIEASCESEGELDAEYGRLDRGIGRTLRDVLHAEGAFERIGLTALDVKNASAAVSLIGTGFAKMDRGTRGVHPDARKALIFEWAPEVREASRVIGKGRHSKRLYTGACFAVALITFRHQPELAESFWRTTAEADGLRAESPELVLREYMLTTPLARRAPAIVARVVAACWNGAFEGRTFKARPYERTTLYPIKIEGTPYDGQRVILPAAVQA